MSSGFAAATRVGSAFTFNNTTLNNNFVADSISTGLFDFDGYNSVGHVYFDEYEFYR